MKFDAKTEKEIQEDSLIKEGDYGFEVIFAEDKVSKSGNQMIALVIGVFTENGNMRKVKDYLVGSMAYKLRHFCDCVGLLPQYQNGSLAADDCHGRTGTCRVVIKPEDGKYPPKNEIKDYVTRPAKPLGNGLAAPKQDEDNLPF